MVYAVIFKEKPDLIKIGHAGNGLAARYGSSRKFDEFWTWSGRYAHETALRCLMGLKPDRGLDWFDINEVRYRLVNETEQDYLDALADRIDLYRCCYRCSHRFFRESNLREDACPKCRYGYVRSPLLGHRVPSKCAELPFSVVVADFKPNRKVFEDHPEVPLPPLARMDSEGNMPLRCQPWRTSDMMRWLRENR